MTQRTGIALNESLVFARNTRYPYRAGLGMLPSAEYVVFFEDFMDEITSNKPPRWDAAIIDTGATLASFETSATGNANGVARITSDGASEGVSIYLPKQVWLSGRRFFMEARVRTAASTDTDLFFGLTDRTAVTNPEDLWNTAADNSLSFGISDGDATPGLTYDKANGGLVTNLATGTAFDVVDATWVTLAFSYNGSTVDATKAVKGYVNGQLAVTAATNAQVPENVLLSPFIGARGGDGAVGTIDIDYVRFAYDRA